MNLVYIDVAIGLIFIYLLLSLFSTVVMEFISTLFRMRADLLKSMIRKMLGENHNKEDVADMFYKRPLIQFLGESRWTFFANLFNDNMPNYLESKNFARTLLGMVSSQVNSISIEKALQDKTILSEVTRQHLSDLFEYAQKDVVKFEKEIELWFDQSMERANGWYKRKVQFILLIIGFGIAIVCNADTLEIISKLQNNPQLRAEIVASAIHFVQKNDSLPTYHSALDSSNRLSRELLQKKVIQEYEKTLVQSNDILGWNGQQIEWKMDSILLKKLGWKFIGFIMTGFALSLGATFWFDMLKKIVNIKILGNNKKE